MFIHSTNLFLGFLVRVVRLRPVSELELRGDSLLPHFNNSVAKWSWVMVAECTWRLSALEVRVPSLPRFPVNADSPSDKTLDSILV